MGFLSPEERSQGAKSSISLGEREVLRYLVKGTSNKKIAEGMKISHGMVNSHLDNVYSKLGCANRLSACCIALKNGLFIPPLKSFQRKKLCIISTL